MVWVNFAKNIIRMIQLFQMSLPLAAVVGIVCFFILKRKGIITEFNLKNKTANAIFLLVVYIALMLQMAILFRPWGTISEIDLIPFNTPGGVRYIILYGIANLVVFLPVGILLPIIWTKINNVKLILFVGFCGSLFIEIFQLVLQCGVVQTEDLIVNTVGAGVGYWIYRTITNYKGRKDKKWKENA